MTKINFPLNTELTTRGGHRAVVFKWFDDCWFGAIFAKESNKWVSWHWDADGTHGIHNSEYDLIPPPSKYRLFISENGVRWVPPDFHLSKLDTDMRLIEIEAPNPKWAIK